MRGKRGFLVLIVVIFLLTGCFSIQKVQAASDTPTVTILLSGGEQVDSVTNGSNVSAPNSRAAGDITITFDGGERVHYTTLDKGSTLDVEVFVEGETIKKVDWSSSDTKVVTIIGDKNGAILEAKGIGVATITAKITTEKDTYEKEVTISTRQPLDWMNGYANADTTMHRAADKDSSVSKEISKNDTFEIRGENGVFYFIVYDGGFGFVLKSKVNIPAMEVILNKEYITMKKDNQDTVSADISPNLYTGEVTWNSNKEDTATINESGKVTGKKEGVAKVSAVAEGMGGNIQAECIVSIWTDITETKAFTSSMVNGKKGAVSGAENTGSIAFGTEVTIVGQCLDYYYVRKADESMVFVEKTALRIPVTNIVLDSEEITIGIGQTYQFFAEVAPESATDKTLKWSSDNANIVTVDKEGKMVAIRTGIAYIEATSSDGTVSAKCRVNVQTEPVFDLANVRSVDILSTKVKYNCIKIYFEAKSSADIEILYQVLFLDEKRNVEWKTQFLSEDTNKSVEYTLAGLDFNKWFTVQVSATYMRNGKKETKKSRELDIKTQKPELSLTLNRIYKDYFKLNFKAMPKDYYDSLEIYYREKGNGKYILLSKKHYKIKKNIIKIDKDLISGKTYEFEARLIKNKKEICKDKVNVTRGYTKLKVSLNKSHTKINLSWEKIAFADGYKIYRSEKKGVLGAKIQTIKKVATTNYSDLIKNLKKGKKYYYQIIPYWTKGKKTHKGLSSQMEIVCKK